MHLAQKNSTNLLKEQYGKIQRSYFGVLFEIWLQVYIWRTQILSNRPKCNKTYSWFYKLMYGSLQGEVCNYVDALKASTERPMKYCLRKFNKSVSMSWQTQPCVRILWKWLRAASKVSLGKTGYNLKTVSHPHLSVLSGSTIQFRWVAYGPWSEGIVCRNVGRGNYYYPCWFSVFLPDEHFVPVLENFKELG
jgi:hypothetical protein